LDEELFEVDPELAKQAEQEEAKALED